MVQIRFLEETRKPALEVEISDSTSEQFYLRAALEIAVRLDLNLWGADLRYADLRKAKLMCANLGGASFQNANLRNSDLRGANFAYANFANAHLEGSNFANVNSVIALGQPNGWWAFAYVYDSELMFRIGCKTKSLADARTYWNKTHPDWFKRQEVAACIEYAVKAAKLRGWEFEE